MYHPFANSMFVGEDSMIPTAVIDSPSNYKPDVFSTGMDKRAKDSWVLYRMRIRPMYLERKTWKDRFRYWLRMTLVKWGLI
jgi:hypothetical protein